MQFEGGDPTVRYGPEDGGGSRQVPALALAGVPAIRTIVLQTTLQNQS